VCSSYIFNLKKKKKKKTELEMTASLSNFISSLVAGGVVVGAIAAALIFISKSDRIVRS
jgi:hypothetical protein